MIGFILGLTLRQLFRRRSTLLLVGLAALPVLLAIVFRLSDPEDVDPERWTARTLYLGLLITGVLPLTALLLGTSVLGDEIEDGTAVYLLTKPLPRWQILAPKLLAAWLITTTLVVSSTIASGVIALDGSGSAIIVGFAVATVIGAFAYSTVFVLLSVVTSRALITGLIYVFLWEGAITGIFHGTRYLSIRHYTLGIAHEIADTPPRVFDAYVGGETALIMIAIVIVAGLFLANRKLQQVEVREPT